MSDLAPGLMASRLGSLGTPYLWVRECSSTQDVIRAAPDLGEGALAVTEHQTAGRGRRGRTWEDTGGDALLCSLLLLPPPGETERFPQLSLAAALAVAEAVEALTGHEALIKWPNDVLLDGRKVAGILLEATDARVIVGLGINVNQTEADLPPGTKLPAASLATISGRRHDRGHLLVSLLERMAAAYDLWQAADGSLAAEVDRRNALRGTGVTVGQVTGRAGSIAADGRLEITQDNGRLVLVGSGEVSTDT